MAPERDQHAATEATPLLASSPVAPVHNGTLSSPSTEDSISTAVQSTHDSEEEEDDDDDDDEREQEKPLNRGQLMVLCYARLVEPIAFFSIFPYINQMIKRNGDLDATDVGFYSGLIESLFSLTQMLVMMFWGRAADRFGRKPVLVFSLVGVSIATSLFGLAQTIPQMIVFRCTAGVFAGTIVTIRVMISEHSTPTTQAKAFSWFAFSGNMGIFFGPLLGGVLADPAVQYPRVFAGIPFFETFPYALSSFVVGLVGLTAVVTSALFLEETLPAEIRQRTLAAHNNNNNNMASPSQSEAAATTAAALAQDAHRGVLAMLNDNYFSLLRLPGVGAAMYTYAHVMVLAFGYTAIVPVFWFTPPQESGFGFTPLLISVYMGISGLSQAIWLLIVFPKLQARVGTNKVLTWCAYSWPFFFAIMPFGNALLRVGTPAAESTFWTILTIGLVVGPGVAMAFTAVQLMVNDVSPDPQALSTLNAMALAMVSGLRSFCPALFTSLFAFSAKNQWLLWGHSVWAVMVVLGLGLALFVALGGLPRASDKKVGSGGGGVVRKKKRKTGMGNGASAGEEANGSSSSPNGGRGE